MSKKTYYRLMYFGIDYSKCQWTRHIYI